MNFVDFSDWQTVEFNERIVVSTSIDSTVRLALSLLIFSVESMPVSAEISDWDGCGEMFSLSSVGALKAVRFSGVFHFVDCVENRDRYIIGCVRSCNGCVGSSGGNGARTSC